MNAPVIGSMDVAGLLKADAANPAKAGCIADKADVGGANA
jgi:hypothetical protein